MMGYGFAIPGLGMGVFWIVLILLLVGGVGLFSGRDRAADPRKSALEILEGRYARGEIGREEFEQKRRDLQE